MLPFLPETILRSGVNGCAALGLPPIDVILGDGDHQAQIGFGHMPGGP
jgi:hypothetical protein